MNRFENNVNDGIKAWEAVDKLHEIAGCIAVNAVMVAGGEVEADEKDSGAWWAMIALAEAVLSGYPEEISKKGFDVVNEITNRELVEKARRKEADEAAKRVMGVIFGIKEG